MTLGHAWRRFGLVVVMAPVVIGGLFLFNSRRSIANDEEIGSYREVLRRSRGQDPSQPPPATRTGGLECAAEFARRNAEPRAEKPVLPSLAPDGGSWPKFDADAHFRELKRQDQLSFQQLLHLDDSDLASAVGRRLFDKLESQSWNRLSEAERAVLAVSWLEGQVSNGGFHQFFSNSSGDLAQDVVPALNAVGLEEFEAIARCALTAFPDGKPSQDGVRRSEELDAWGEAQFEIFDALDTAFYRVETDADLALGRYIRKHASGFTF